MKKILLLMMTLVLVVSGIKADPSISKNGSTITLSGFNAGDLAKVFAGEIEGISASDFSGVSRIVFGSGCALNADDFTAMSSTTHSELSGVKTVDMSNATVSVDTSEGSTATAISTMKDMNLANMEYLRLPSSFDNAPDMKALRSASKNAKLKMVMSTDESDDQRKKVRMYSFEENNVNKASKALDIHLAEMKYVDMAGYYGKNDLYDHSTNQMVFGTGNNAPAVWDFTGANFSECTIDAGTGGQLGTADLSYYDYDDPFCEGTQSQKSTPFESNSFFYFTKNYNYAQRAVSIKLPDVDMDVLPMHSLYKLGSDNKSNYMLVNNMTDAEFQTAFGNSAQGAPIEELVIPACYETLDIECAKESLVKDVVIGSGVKVIDGGAFYLCSKLENIDFAAGISDCYVGDRAFSDNNSIKHIALSEGIVSLGANCFTLAHHLESIRLPETLINIGNNAFDDCLALNSVTIPSNVEKIGQQAFRLCPFTDVYLTTTDPNKIPLVWSAGIFGDSNFDGRASFNQGQFYGWGGFSDNVWETVNGMTWDEAMEWYYVHVNGIPVLHYPEALADKVKAQISATYIAQTSQDEEGKTYGLPGNRNDMSKRSADNIENNYPGVDLLDENNKGKYTQDGWSQFVLMKAYKPGGESIVYTKEYNDVWYTMCFPFDLTDEQLAAAFNENFNIADFSGVELKAKTDTDPMKMILHFNKVAVTYYKGMVKDAETGESVEKVFYRLCDDHQTIYRGLQNQKVWREPHGEFSYNVYVDPDNTSVQYHHVHPKGGKLNSNKTKTFAISTAAGQGNADEAIIIDGILAEAGHPYMIHPAIGVNPGQPKKACNMAGITWRPEETRAQLYEDRARTVDLGIESTEEDNWDNYYQAAYNNLDGKNYKGNTYTFIGNYKDFKDGWQEDSTLPARPTDAELVEPKAPQNPNKKPTPPRKAELPMPTNPEDNPVSNPAEDTETYPAKLQTFYNTTASINGVNHKWGELISTFAFTDVVQQLNWNGTAYQLMYYATNAFNAYFENPNGEYAGEIPVSVFDESKFNQLKSECGRFNAALTTYNNYLADVANYPSKLQAYQDSKAEWDRYRAQLAEWNSWVAPADEQAAYNTAYAAWQTAVDNYNTWKTAMGNKGYNVVIPQYAYFLGTKTGEIYPKYFRERETKPNRSTGLWTQYTAIVMPNDEAIAGVEKDLDAKTQVASGSKIAFNEPFFFIDDTPQGIATLIEKIEKEEGKAPNVEYMDIVVSIDGKIVSRDKTTFEGLPKGVYIINGKKYYVK